MSGKRVTIYDIAKELGMSASYVSRALNDHPVVSSKIKEKVKKKAKELNYKHNSHAANLRQGSTRTIGVIIPQINQGFFSEAIAGIEEACYENKYSLIICQSHESFQQECKAIETLIHQNVDCILISISAETKSAAHLEAIRENHIDVIQFDRFTDDLDGFKVINDNQEAAYAIVKHLVKEGYRKIAFIGGPENLTTFRNRKEGFIRGIKEAKLSIPYNYIVENAFTKEETTRVVTELLKSGERPDAFVTVADHQSLAILQAAEALNIKVPEQLGIAGFANEFFTEMIAPSLSTTDQKSKELGKQAANLFFNKGLKGQPSLTKEDKLIIKTKLIIRKSSQRAAGKAVPAKTTRASSKTY
ncbi:LacI family transcriptional regulator [Pseudoflavitalea sp. X16]|uniref:LacI family DNA-binding transcriptional regulator n=1 Tax=Paraflavitalea devenefica TaxID=2716334 RepID=UPI0014208249|nr:LacI family DNA-binding transcriptional regulator [Paraflavitalea devenefica]NII28377.1 LacI family transcriptional regulator [Paraflavitalea devenefica]